MSNLPDCVPDPQMPLVQAGVELLRHTLDQTPLHPHVFDEIAVAAKALHKACCALDPILNLPKSGTAPLAPSPQSEGVGASAMRQIVSAIQDVAGGGRPKQSRKDLMASIVVAERAGLEDDAKLLRAELHGEAVDIEDDLLSPPAKVERANELLAKSSELTGRAKQLLESVPKDKIIDIDGPVDTAASS